VSKNTAEIRDSLLAFHRRRHPDVTLGSGLPGRAFSSSHASVATMPVALREVVSAVMREFDVQEPAWLSLPDVALGAALAQHQNTNGFIVNFFTRTAFGFGLGWLEPSTRRRCGG
jgi:hypothetical protein